MLYRYHLTNFSTPSINSMAELSYFYKYWSPEPREELICSSSCWELPYSKWQAQNSVLYLYSANPRNHNSYESHCFLSVAIRSFNSSNACVLLCPRAPIRSQMGCSTMRNTGITATAMTGDFTPRSAMAWGLQVFRPLPLPPHPDLEEN